MVMHSLFFLEVYGYHNILFIFLWYWLGLVLYFNQLHIDGYLPQQVLYAEHGQFFYFQFLMIAQFQLFLFSIVLPCF